MLSRDLELSGYFRVLDPRTLHRGSADRRRDRRHDRLRRVGGDRRAAAREGHGRERSGHRHPRGPAVRRRGAPRRGGLRPPAPGIPRRSASHGAPLRRPAPRGVHRRARTVRLEDRAHQHARRPAQGRVRLHLRHDDAGAAHQRALHHGRAAPGGPISAACSSPPTASTCRGCSRWTSTSRAVVQFSNDGKTYLGGVWSPDGTQVLATREDDGNSDIELLDRWGNVTKRLTDHWAHRRLARLGARRPALRLLLEPLRRAADLHDVDRWLGARPGVANRHLQHLARVVAEGRPHRLVDAHGEHIPDRRRRCGRLQPEDHHRRGQQRGSVVGAGRPLSRLLVVARGQSHAVARRSRRAHAETIDPRGGDDTSPAWSSRSE